MATLKGLWSTLVSNREDIRDAIQMQYYINPYVRPVELEKRLEELSRAISDIEQQYKM